MWNSTFELTFVVTLKAVVAIGEDHETLAPKDSES